MKKFKFFLPLILSLGFMLLCFQYSSAEQTGTGDGYTYKAEWPNGILTCPNSGTSCKKTSVKN